MEHSGDNDDDYADNDYDGDDADKAPLPSGQLRVLGAYQRDHSTRTEELIYGRSTYDLPCSTNKVVVSFLRVSQLLWSWYSLNMVLPGDPTGTPVVAKPRRGPVRRQISTVVNSSFRQGSTVATAAAPPSLGDTSTFQVSMAGVGTTILDGIRVMLLPLVQNAFGLPQGNSLQEKPQQSSIPPLHKFHVALRVLRNFTDDPGQDQPTYFRDPAQFLAMDGLLAKQEVMLLNFGTGFAKTAMVFAAALSEQNDAKRSFTVAPFHALVQQSVRTAVSKGLRV